jgi:hypothetical protein
VQFYNEVISPLKNEINDLKVKQDMLYETIINLKHIISNDNLDTDENKQHIKSIEEEVNNMYINYGKRIYKIEEEVFKNETNTSEKEEEEKEEEEETDDSPVPIQNHIKFPHFVMYNDSNYQKSEIGNMKWFTYEQCLEKIRFYNIEKINLITSINKLLENYNIF